MAKPRLVIQNAKVFKMRIAVAQEHAEREVGKKLAQRSRGIGAYQLQGAGNIVIAANVFAAAQAVAHATMPCLCPGWRPSVPQTALHFAPRCSRSSRDTQAGGAAAGRQAQAYAALGSGFVRELEYRALEQRGRWLASNADTQRLDLFWSVHSASSTCKWANALCKSCALGTP